uniref:Uncharacterized protein n=1 Tax=Wuchereria bancrofti TaxID=6293 RepID=A0AAF5RXA4_WUCBA
MYVCMCMQFDRIFLKTSQIVTYAKSSD